MPSACGDHQLKHPLERDVECGEHGISPPRKRRYSTQSNLRTLQADSCSVERKSLAGLAVAP